MAGSINVALPPAIDECENCRGPVVQECAGFCSEECMNEWTEDRMTFHMIRAVAEATETGLWN